MLQDWCRETGKEAILIIQVRNNESLNRGSEGGKKETDSKDTSEKDFTGLSCLEMEIMFFKYFAYMFNIKF